MSGITMCANKTCKLRKRCYRQLAPVGQRQSWASFRNPKKEHCFIDFYEDGSKKKEGK